MRHLRPTLAQWLIDSMTQFFQDLRYGFRMLANSPGFTAVAVLTLALGIGANSAIFTLVNAYLLRPLPVAEPGRLVLVSEIQAAKGFVGSVSFPTYLDWREQNQVFEELAAVRGEDFNLTGTDEPERLYGARVSAGFFRTLGVRPILGRGFLPEEDKPGGARVVVLSRGFWQRRSGARPDILGQALTLDGERFTVVGVAPSGFRISRTAPYELWVPLALEPNRAGRGTHFLLVIARLKPGISIERAQADLSAISSRLARQYPENFGWGAVVENLHARLMREARPALLVLLAAVGLVLLIACANLANLLVARGAARQKEIAIRTALGAGRLRVVRQMLTESLLLALLGGGLGLLLALWGVNLLNAIIPAGIQPLQAARADATVLGFTLLVSLATGVLFGLAPALNVSKPDLAQTLKEGGRSSSAAGRHGRLRDSLVVSEVALAMVLLVGAGLLIKSFMRLQQVDPGFRSESVLTIELSLPQARYSKPQQRATFYEQLLERIAGLPGVRAAGACTQLSLSGGETIWGLTIEGRPEPGPGEILQSGHRSVSPDYFRAMSIPLRRGRYFTAQDREGAPGVVIINETMANRFWPSQDPIGKRIRLGAGRSGAPWIPIAGVVADVKYSGLDRQPGPEMFLPHLQNPAPRMAIVVRAAAEPASLATALRSAVTALDRDQPVANIRTLEKIVSDSVAPRRLTMLLLGIFAALALVLAGVGLCGVISYSVTQRTHELGVRMALGAQPSEVLRLVIGHGMILTMIGVAIGLAGAFALTGFLSSLLFGVTARDPATFLAVALALASVALAACYIPARRATRVDPMVALRYE